MWANLILESSDAFFASDERTKHCGTKQDNQGRQARRVRPDKAIVPHLITSNIRLCN